MEGASPAGAPDTGAGVAGGTDAFSGSPFEQAPRTSATAMAIATGARVRAWWLRDRILRGLHGWTIHVERSGATRVTTCGGGTSQPANSITTRRERALFFSIFATRRAPISRVFATWVP